MRVITLDINKKVISVKDVGDDYTLQDGELHNEIGEFEQILQSDGTFITPEPIPVEPQPHEPTNSDIAQMISDLQIDLIIAGVI